MAGRPKTRARRIAAAELAVETEEQRSMVATLPQPTAPSIPDLDEDGNVLPEYNVGRLDPEIVALNNDPLELKTANLKNASIARQMAEDTRILEARHQQAKRNAEAKRMGTHRPEMVDDGTFIKPKPDAPQRVMEPMQPPEPFAFPQGDVEPQEQYVPQDRLEIPEDLDPVEAMPQPRQEAEVIENKPIDGHISLEDRVKQLEDIMAVLVREREVQQKMTMRTMSELIEYECVANQAGKGCGHIDKYPKRWVPGTTCLNCGHSGLLPLS